MFHVCYRKHHQLITARSSLHQWRPLFIPFGALWENLFMSPYVTSHLCTLNCKYLYSPEVNPRSPITPRILIKYIKQYYIGVSYDTNCSQWIKSRFLTFHFDLAACTEVFFRTTDSWQNITTIMFSISLRQDLGNQEALLKKRTTL